MAWAVPAVSLVTAAPALATSHTEEAVLKIRRLAAYGRRRRMNVEMGRVVNTGEGKAGLLVAVFDLPNRLEAVRLESEIPDGWTLAGDRTGKRYTFVTKDGVEPGNYAPALHFTVSHNKVRPIAEGIVTVAVSGARSGSDTASTEVVKHTEDDD